MPIITFPDIHGETQTVDTSQERFNLAFNADCREFMRNCPDKAFSWLIADPPYGDGQDSSQNCNVEREREREREVEPVRRVVRPLQGTTASEIRGADSSDTRQRQHYVNRGGWHGKDKYHLGSFPDGRDVGGEVRKKIIAWDVAPEKEVFDELFRVSRDQAIFGGNYFTLPPTRCFLIWRKLSISEGFSMAMAEYIWTSANMNAKVFECAPQGKAGDPRFHVCQKPVEVYRWIYNTLCKPGDTIFDPYMGSGSSRIAAYEAGLNYVGVEIDPFYFEQEEARFARYTEQISFWE